MPAGRISPELWFFFLFLLLQPNKVFFFFFFLILKQNKTLDCIMLLILMIAMTMTTIVAVVIAAVFKIVRDYHLLVMQILCFGQIFNKWTMPLPVNSSLTSRLLGESSGEWPSTKLHTRYH